MTDYMCLDCQKEIKFELVKKRVRCPYCGSKILYKPRVTSAVVESMQKWKLIKKLKVK